MTRSIGIIFVLLVFSLLPVVAQSGDDEVISVDTSIVVLNATVTDKSGEAVRGLERQSFRVLEDGVEQEIRTFESEETPFAAVILLDTSGSMEQRITLARSAAIQFLDGLRAQDFVSIYRFDSKVEMVQDFSNSRVMDERIFDLKAAGMTLLNDAIYKAAQVLSTRAESRRAIIVLSDGADTMSKRSSDKALRAALAANATIYTVDMSDVNTGGLKRMQNAGLLKRFAERTGGMFIAAPGGLAMRDAFKRAVEELGVQYTIAYEPSNTRKDGRWRAIEVRISKPDLAIRTRKGYNAPKAK